MNRVTLMGRLTRDPELKKTQAGKSMCAFDLAVNTRGKTYFIKCKAWGITAENLSKYIRKGGMVGVDGSLQVSTYDTENGKKTITEVVCDEIAFAGKTDPFAEGNGISEEELPF